MAEKKVTAKKKEIKEGIYPTYNENILGAAKADAGYPNTHIQAVEPGKDERGVDIITAGSVWRLPDGYTFKPHGIFEPVKKAGSN